MDTQVHKLIFIGRLHWRYRWQHIAFAIKVLWRAIWGYHISVECSEALELAQESAARFCEHIEDHKNEQMRSLF